MNSYARGSQKLRRRVRSQLLLTWVIDVRASIETVTEGVDAQWAFMRIQISDSELAGKMREVDCRCKG